MGRFERVLEVNGSRVSLIKHLRCNALPYRLGDKTLEAGLVLVGATKLNTSSFPFASVSYSRDNSVILDDIQAYDLDVELGLFLLSLRHAIVCSTLLPT